MSPRQGRHGEELVRDPACLTYVPRSAAVAATVAGEPLFFCSEVCAESYRRIKEG
jgi:YHS domain-containing protein